MWDNNIMKAYGVKGTPRDYVFHFLPLMKEFSNQVIESYSKDLDVTREEAIDTLNKYRPDKTLVKLLDEYNWITYTYFGKRWRCQRIVDHLYYSIMDANQPRKPLFVQARATNNDIYCYT